MSEPKEYLYMIRPTRIEMVTHGPTPEETRIVSQHSAYLDQLAERGVLQVFGRTQNADEDVFGIVIFVADSEEAARTIMENDPAVKYGVMSARLYPYRIAYIRKA
ncbi:MAG TPA: YciI family protein [Anaerolineae bacterium]|nr:YciI family protein [Anaerolineae bacterium]